MVCLEQMIRLWRNTMCRAMVCMQQTVWLERSSGAVKFVVLEADGMTGEKYNVSFNLVTWTKWYDWGEVSCAIWWRVLQESRTTRGEMNVFLQHCHWIWCIRETSGLIEICLGSKPVTQTFFFSAFSVENDLKEGDIISFASEYTAKKAYEVPTILFTAGLSRSERYSTDNVNSRYAARISTALRWTM